MNQTKPDKKNRLQLRIDIVLTVLFLAVIFFMGAMTPVSYTHLTLPTTQAV